MKKILFTSLLCASFAATVNLLPAPPADETDGRGTRKQTVSVPQAEQDANFLQAQNAVAPLIKDLQKVSFRGGDNSELSTLLAKNQRIKHPEKSLFFPASAFEKLMDMHCNAFCIKNNAKKPDAFKEPIAELAKVFGWKDSEAENNSDSDIVTKLFALHQALSADKPQGTDVEFRARILQEKLDPAFTFWKKIRGDVEAMLAKQATKDIEQIALSAFNHKGEKGDLLTAKDASLLLDTFFARMFSVRSKFTGNKGIDFKELGKEISFKELGKEISNKYGLSEALKNSSNDAEKALYAKIRERDSRKVRSVHDVFPNFLKQTVSMKAEDLKRFAWLGIPLKHQNDEVTVAELLKACYSWHASKIAGKNKGEAAAKQEQKTAIAAQRDALKKKLQELEDQEKKLNAK
ncbi:MAG: hypothetical protein V6Z78_00575 [Holosporaceae bacterium]